MVRSKQKGRGVHRFQKRKIILLGVEGTNRTERIYFDHFNRLQKNYVVRFAPENVTDPVRIVESVQKVLEKRKDSIHIASGQDVACAVFDTDVERKKASAIREAGRIAKAAGIQLVLSNPCFEVWFLLHFVYSTAGYATNDAVLRALRRYIPAYQKNMDVFELLREKLPRAIAHAQRLRKYHQESGNAFVMERNPSSDADQIVALLCPMEQ